MSRSSSESIEVAYRELDPDGTAIDCWIASRLVPGAERMSISFWRSLCTVSSSFEAADVDGREQLGCWFDD